MTMLGTCYILSKTSLSPNNVHNSLNTIYTSIRPSGGVPPVPCEGGETLLGSDEVNSPLVPGRQFDAVSSLIVAATLSSVENDLQVHKRKIADNRMRANKNHCRFCRKTRTDAGDKVCYQFGVLFLWNCNWKRIQMFLVLKKLTQTTLKTDLRIYGLNGVNFFLNWTRNLLFQDLTSRLGFETQPPSANSHINDSAFDSTTNRTHIDDIDDWPPSSRILWSQPPTETSRQRHTHHPDKTRCDRDSLFHPVVDYCSVGDVKRDNKKDTMENTLSSMIRHLLLDDASSNSAQRHDLLSHAKFGFL